MLPVRFSAAALIVIVSANIACAQADKTEPVAPPAGGGLFSGTPEEQAACSPDAVKYCRDDIPAVFAVLACLQSHREKLKKSCRDVLEAHGQ